MAGIDKYSTTPASNNAASPDGFAENMRPSGVNDSARQVMADIRTWYEDAEWLKLGVNGSPNGFSISYVSASVFKFPGTDRRSLIPVNRRVKAGIGSGVIYGTVTDSSLSASDTQITVAWDSGSLDSSLSYISLGILSPTNDSIPRNLDQSFSDVHVSGTLNSLFAARMCGFVTFSGGTPTLAASSIGSGTLSLSDVAKGRTQVKFSVSFTSSSYTVLALQEAGSSPIVSDRTKNDFILDTRDMSLSATDVNFSFAVFGVQ